MAWCEAAQKVCLYLEDMDEVKSQSILARAVDADERTQALSEAFTNATERAIALSKDICQPERCGAITMALVGMLHNTAQITIISDYLRRQGK